MQVLRKPQIVDSELDLVGWYIPVAIAVVTVENRILVVFSRSAQKRKGKFKTATHELMVRMAFSPRDIWGTPSSQPIHQVSKLKEAVCLTTLSSDILKPTADETTDTDGGGKGTTAGLVGGVESV